MFFLPNKIFMLILEVHFARSYKGCSQRTWNNYINDEQFFRSLVKVFGLLVFTGELNVSVHISSRKACVGFSACVQPFVACVFFLSSAVMGMIVCVCVLKQVYEPLTLGPMCGLFWIN